MPDSPAGPLLVSRRVLLEPFTAVHCSDDYIGWLNDPLVTKYLEIGRTHSTHESVQPFLARFKGSTTDYLFAIIDRDTNLHLGTVTLNAVHPYHHSAHTGLMIGRRDYWGRGYALEAWKLLLDYAFTMIRCHKIHAGVLEGNIVCQRTLTRLGFTQEGRERKSHWVGDAYQDVIQFGLLWDESR